MRNLEKKNILFRKLECEMNLRGVKCNIRESERIVRLCLDDMSA